MSKAEVLVKITISNLENNQEAIDLGFDNFEHLVDWLIQEEGHFIGIMDDEYEIISIREIKEDE